jgi:hypothetical protein
MTTLSLRRLWTMYKRVLAEDGFSRRELVFAQAAFYAGARSTLKVLGYLLEWDDEDELHRTIERHARQIKAIQGLRPRARRH